MHPAHAPRPANRLPLLALAPLLALIAATPVRAATEYNLQVPLLDDFDSCTGERVEISGIQHIVGRVTQDGAGRWHFGFTRNTRGGGVGSVSGVRYILTDAVARASLEVAPGEVKTLTEEYSSRLIRVGETAPSDDSVVHLLSRITLDANGQVTASVTVVRATCK